jgi:hypothetical protein
VDNHDPSLELSLIRNIKWPQQPLSLSSVPLTLCWTGHYKEPELQLVSIWKPPLFVTSSCPTTRTCNSGRP